MTGIVVAGHGSYADGILSAIELVAGKPQEIKGVNFTKGQGVEELRENLKWAITCLEAQEILIMVDILGGSPFNVAVQLMAEGVGKRMRLVAGVNKVRSDNAEGSRAEIQEKAVKLHVGIAGA